MYGNTNTRKTLFKRLSAQPKLAALFLSRAEEQGVNSLAPHSQVKGAKTVGTQFLSQTASEDLVERDNLVVHVVVPLLVYTAHDKQSV